MIEVIAKIGWKSLAKVDKPITEIIVYQGKVIFSTEDYCHYINSDGNVVALTF